MNSETRRSTDRTNRALRALDNEKHVKDLIDSGQFKEEDEKGIDVPYFDLESILAATESFSDANKLGEGGYGPVYKVISIVLIGVQSSCKLVFA
jgi:CTP-dependent riboflavin kinase